jgi:hypothetical protein
MQVGRAPSGASGGRLSNTWVTCPSVGDNRPKGWLRPHALPGSDRGGKQRCAGGGARGRLAGWWGDGPPRRRSVAGLRGWSARLGLRDGPDSCGRQQLGILGNGRKPDPATPRGRRSPSGCKALFSGTNLTVPEEEAPANYVPAAAVIRRGRALSGFIGRKARVGGFASRP